MYFNPVNVMFVDSNHECHIFSNKIHLYYFAMRQPIFSEVYVVILDIM